MAETTDSQNDTDSKLPRSKSFFPASVENPFVHKLNFSTMDKIQIGIMTVTIVPLRLLGVGLCLVMGWIFATVTLAGLSPEQLKEPLSGWRRTIRPATTFFCRGVFFCAGFHWIRYKGKRAPTCEAQLLALAPHSSYFDVLVPTALGMNATVAKAATTKVPIFSTLTNFTQPVLVSREDPDSRVNTCKEIQRRAKSGGAWPQIVIFPEGTCTNRSCLIAFKPGAFYPGVPVQPVCLKYNNKLDTITWTWDGPGALEVLWYTLCQFNNSLEVTFLPVYTPSEEEKADPKLFARNVRQKMAECLGIPTTDHTFEDCRLMLYASKINFPAAAGLIEFHKISKKLGMNYDNLKQLLNKFTEIAQDKKNAVTLEELAKYLDLPVSEALEEMFSLYDRDGSGTIDFREYVIGLHLVAEPANTENTIKFAFQVFDAGNKGYITEDELCEILHNAFSMDMDAAHRLFKQVDADSNGHITFDEFCDYAKLRPEYAKLFVTYHELQEKKAKKSPDSTNQNEADVKVKEE